MVKSTLKTSDEIAEILGIATITVQRLAAKGELPARKLAGRWRFDLEQIMAWLRKEASSGMAPESPKYGDIVDALERVEARLNSINTSIRMVGQTIKQQGDRHGTDR